MEKGRGEYGLRCNGKERNDKIDPGKVGTDGWIRLKCD